MKEVYIKEKTFGKNCKAVYELQRERGIQQQGYV